MSGLCTPLGGPEHQRINRQSVIERVPRSEADRMELEAWLAAHGDAVGLGWAAGPGSLLANDFQLVP
jgi:hypothetical protein